jgi:probable rRNA maturation factor
MPSSILHPPSSLVLSVANRQRTKKINTRFLKQVVAEIFAELKITDAELGVNLVGAEEMARVNWQFLRHEGPTDVITFDHAAPVAALVKARTKSRTTFRAFTSAATSLHGELFVCVDEAVSQAKNFKTSWQAETVRYVVHGVLHLLGYDDLKPDLRRKMKRAENRLVRRLAGRFLFTRI